MQCGGRLGGLLTEESSLFLGAAWYSCAAPQSRVQTLELSACSVLSLVPIAWYAFDSLAVKSSSVTGGLGVGNVCIDGGSEGAAGRARAHADTTGPPVVSLAVAAFCASLRLRACASAFWRMWRCGKRRGRMAPLSLAIYATRQSCAICVTTRDGDAPCACAQVPASSVLPCAIRSSRRHIRRRKRGSPTW